jgi:pimeloyl-ACP methyl ester carboxylesterase
MPIALLDDSLPIYFEVNGTGSPLLFIHPPGMGLVTFKQQQSLAKKFKIITFDLRGNGRSGADSEKISISLLANDIVKLLDYLKMEKITLCGYSNGGSIALEFALSNPDRVNGLILLGGFPEVNTFLLRSEFLLGIYTMKMKGIKVLAKVLGKSHGVSKGYQKEIEEYVLKSNQKILYQMYVEGLKYNCTKRLSEINVPVLLVDGTRDYYLHSYQKMLEKRIKNTKKVFVPKARHQLVTRHAHELNKIIEEFMSKELTI